MGLLRIPKRIPPWVYDHGTEPDPRFSLANERTFLAWIRTALAVFAAGVALEALDLPIQAAWRSAAAVMFVVLGLLAAAQAWLGWARTERALRIGRTLPGPSLSTIVTGGVIIAMILVGVGLWLR